MYSKPVLVAGATGYVGGRLVSRLLSSGYHVRAVARSLAKLRCRPWAQHRNLELVECDVLDLASLKKAMSGCGASFHLIHPPEKNAAALAAHNFAVAAANSQIERIIHLARVGDSDGPCCGKGPRSRREPGLILQSGTVPVTTLRAALILGSGSSAFEILRCLTDRQPIMFAPRWFRSAVQPIGIRNVLTYLEGCLHSQEVIGQTFDIGGPDLVNFRELIEIYAQEAGLPRRIILPIPFVGLNLSSYWIHLLTPVSGSIAKSLARGLKCDAICRENRIVSIIPQHLMNCREIIRLALERMSQQLVESCWSDAGALNAPEWTCRGDAEYAGGTIFQYGCRIHIEATPEEVWEPIARIGGNTGWYSGQLLWSLRGWMDRLIGGAGLARGRRHPSELHVGDALDFWRVLDCRPRQHLVLVAEMKTPGEAVLELRLKPLPDGRTELRQLSRFLPKGLWGLVYWYSLYPFHVWIFQGMLRNIARAIGKPVSLGPESLASKLQQQCPISSKSD